LIHSALWANRADLSMWSIITGEDEQSCRVDDHHQGRILVNDAHVLAERIAGLQAGRIDLIVDNAGFELVCDLCLVDFLLASRAADTIYLHLKAHPIFVSDAMHKDVHHTIAALAACATPEVRNLPERLQNYLASGRLRLREDLFWTAPLTFWEMPPRLRLELARSSLVLVKGDANYRRLLGDRQWPFTTPFQQIVSYFPAPLLALRTLKAELAAGLDPAQVTAVSSADPQWLIAGRWGVIQFADPQPAADRRRNLP
jgi:hypothetical protein